MDLQPSMSAAALDTPSTTTTSRMQESSLSPVTPEGVRPLPKAGIRKATVNQRKKKITSSILTDTPVKEALRIEQNERKAKQDKIQEKKNRRAYTVNELKANKAMKNKKVKMTKMEMETKGKLLTKQ